MNTLPYLNPSRTRQLLDALAQRVFDELELEQGGPRRHPLESETFRELLAEPALVQAA